MIFKRFNVGTNFSIMSEPWREAQSLVLIIKKGNSFPRMSLGLPISIFKRPRES